MIDSLMEFLERALFQVAGVDVTAGGLLVAALCIFGALAVSRFMQWSVGRWLTKRSEEPLPTTLGAMLDLLLLTGGVVLALERLGADLPALLSHDLFRISHDAVTPATLIGVAGIMIFALIASRITQAALQRTVRDGSPQGRATMATIGRLVHYVIMTLAVVMALQTLGIDIAALLALGGVLVLAFGFAMKNIAENFVSGVILLVERAIKPNDVLEVEGRLVRVQHLGIRTTVLRTRDGEELLVPNATMVGSTVTNYTFRDAQYRLRVGVGVGCDSDADEVIAALERASDALSHRVADHETEVQLLEFGDSTLNFEVGVWIRDPWQRRRAKSELNVAILRELTAADIEIPYAQLDVHMDSAEPKSAAA